MNKVHILALLWVIEPEHFDTFLRQCIAFCRRGMAQELYSIPRSRRFHVVKISQLAQRLTHARETDHSAPRLNRPAASLVALLAALGMAAGYARDAGMAAIFGASATSDAFFIGTLIPTVLGTILITGALTPALIPVLARQDSKAAEKLFNLILSIVSVLLLLVCFVVAWQVVPLVNFLAPGADAERLMLSARFVLITLPALWLLGVAAVLGAFANVRGSFGVPASSALFVNGAMFAAVLFSARSEQLELVAWGMVAGAALLVLVQWVQLWRHGWHFFPRLARDPGAFQVLRLFLPLLAFILLAQTVPVIERRIAAGFPSGELSHVAYAGKLYQIPATLLPASFAVVLFPALVHLLRQEKNSGYVELLREGISGILFVMLPASGLILFAAPAIVRVVFQRGAFLPQDTVATAMLLRYYALAIVPGGLLLVLTRGFHARRDMLTPLWIGIFNTALYAGTAWYLGALIGLVALPLAFAFSQVTGTVITLCVLVWQLKVPVRALLDYSIVRMLFAAAPMLVLFGLGAAFLSPYIESGSIWFIIAVWLAVGLLGCLIFFGAALRLRVPDAILLRNRILRMRAADDEKVSI